MPGTVEVQTDRDLPWVMNFQSFKFSGRQMLRGNVGGEGGAKWDLWLPPPKQINGIDSINYTQEFKDEGINPSWQGITDFFNTGMGIGTGALDVIQVSGSFGLEKMDERMATFGGASLRPHRYDWELVPTSIEESKSIEEVARAFQVGAYPLFGGDMNISAASRVVHPDLWLINSAQLSGVGGKFGDNWRWDMSPLPSVIQSVNITSQGAAGGSYAMGNRRDNHPVKWNLSVTFVELEPAINAKDRLVTRSAIRNHNKSWLTDNK